MVDSTLTQHGCVSSSFLWAKQESVAKSFLGSSGTQETDTRTHSGHLSALGPCFSLTVVGEAPACPHQCGCMGHEQDGRWWNLLQGTVVSKTVVVVGAASSAYVKGFMSDLGGPGFLAAVLAIRNLGTSVLEPGKASVKATVSMGRQGFGASLARSEQGFLLLGPW